MKRKIYILLLISFFSATLRLSPESPLTLFRILIPYCLCIIYIVNRNILFNLVKYSFFLLVIALVQNFMTRLFFFPTIEIFSYSFLMMFYLHYFTIFVVVALVYSLWYIDKEHFFENSIRYASKVTKLCILIFAFYILIGGDHMEFVIIGGNINNFACLLTSGMLALLFDKSTKKTNTIIYISLIPLILLYNDSKLALMGCVLILSLFAIHHMSIKIPKKLRVKIFLGLIALLVFAVYMFFISPTSAINGYDMASLVLFPVESIVNGEYFDESSSSIAFRTNSIIGIFQILKTSFGIGVAPGNTSIILTTLMPDRGGRFSEMDYTSPHIWWLELMADLGWLIIIPSLKILYVQFRSYCSLNGSSACLFSQLFFISFPIWCASASSLYTEYYCIMMITISFIVYKSRKEANI